MDRNLFKDTVAAQLGGGATFDVDAAGGASTHKVLIGPHADLWVFSFSTVPHVLTVNWRNGESFSPPAGLFLPTFTPVDGTTVESVSLDAADPFVWFIVVAHGTPPPAGFLRRDFQGSSGVFGPIIVAINTAETIESTVTVTKGQIVYYTLSMGGKQAGDVALLVYVALKGATTGTYYAVTMGNSLSGSFMVPASEVVSLVVRNASGANAYAMAGYAEARGQG